MHRAAIALLAASALAAACNANVVTDPGGTTGAGGRGATTSTTTTPVTSTSTTTTPSTSSTTVTHTSPDPDAGAGGATPACTHCDFLLQQAAPEGQPICEASQALWTAFRDCVCVKVCPFPCGDNVCKATPGPMTPECTDCVKGSCADAFSACLADQ
jgi:hypothetical protein